MAAGVIELTSLVARVLRPACKSKYFPAWGCISKLLDRGKITELELQGLEDAFDDEDEDEDEEEDEDEDEEDEDEVEEIDEYDDADVDVTGEN